MYVLAVKVYSSCTPGTVLLGTNYLKGDNPKVALEDEEYPEWLWQLLDKDGKIIKSEKVQEREKRKQVIRETNFLKTQ